MTRNVFVPLCLIALFSFEIRSHFMNHEHGLSIPQYQGKKRAIKTIHLNQTVNFVPVCETLSTDNKRPMPSV